jgi:hypothetical protein
MSSSDNRGDVESRSSRYYRVPSERLNEFRVQPKLRLRAQEGGYYEIPRDRLEEFRVSDDEAQQLRESGEPRTVLPVSRGAMSFPKGFPPGPQGGGPAGGQLRFIARPGGGPAGGAAAAGGPPLGGPAGGQLRFIARPGGGPGRPGFSPSGT